MLKLLCTIDTHKLLTIIHAGDVDSSLPSRGIQGSWNIATTPKPHQSVKRTTTSQE